MSAYAASSTWSTKSRRRRPIVIWILLLLIIGLTTLLFSTTKLARQVDVGIQRRAANLQEPLQNLAGDDGEGVDEVAHNSEHIPTSPREPVPAAKTVTESVEGFGYPNWLNAPDTIAFPAYVKYAALVDKADTLPEIVYIPFEHAVKDDKLAGWEAEWLLNGTYSTKKWGLLKEPRIDFVYTWVNGSDDDFRATKKPYELNSTLNDNEGAWISRHGENRYRDWNELKYSVRSIEKYAPFRNKIQLLVNSLNNAKGQTIKQSPGWLDQKKSSGIFEVLAQEDFFGAREQDCLPSFNSLTIENQLYNTESGVDRLFALSDDMMLGRPHAASDIYSPLYGPLYAFKTNSYNTVHRPTEADAKRFGEKPWLIYTSWLLNRRFGSRKRKGQAHFGHSLSRSLHREAMQSFPGPELQSACSRFRGDFGFQLYSWYATFHYTIERHREVLLWSYLVNRMDTNRDGYFSWSEREQIINDLEEGLGNEGKSSYRSRNFYHMPETLEAAGLDPPKVNLDILWTSMDGPVTAKDIDCLNFDVNDCLAPGFSAEDISDPTKTPAFSTAAILDRVSRQQPGCGDCLIKILLHRKQKGLEPLMPFNETQPAVFETVVKALMRYQYVVHEPDALFIMVTDAEQVETTLIKRLLTKQKLVGQLCLNDDVSTEDESELEELHSTMNKLFEGMFPQPSRFERSK